MSKDKLSPTREASIRVVPGVVIEIRRDGDTVITSCNQTRLRCYEHENDTLAQETYNTIRDMLVDVNVLIDQRNRDGITAETIPEGLDREEWESLIASIPNGKVAQQLAAKKVATGREARLCAAASAWLFRNPI